MRVQFCVAAAAAALAMATPAAASIVTIDFAGNLNRAYFGGATGRFTGTATYDTAAADPNNEYQNGVVTDFSITSSLFNSLYGQTTLTKAGTGGTGDVHLVPDDAAAGYDQYELTFHLGGAPRVQLNMDLLFAQGSIPGGFGLPKTLPTLATATFAGSRLDDFYGDLTLGSITRFDLSYVDPTPSPTATPEPAAWALMIVGFGGAGAALRRRKLRTA